jgi:ParB-like chromosome segregation protein Spo0J
MKLSDIKLNPNNPRVLRDEKFKKLVKSIQEFPKMMKLRPIVVDSENIVLGGNMRLKALQELKYKEIPDEWVKQANELTEEEKKRFIIADNVGFGEWDWDLLANEWDESDLNDWGVDLPVYSNNIEEIIELDKIVTTYNINIKCDSPDELEEMKFKLGITANSISASMIMGLLT